MKKLFFFCIAILALSITKVQAQQRDRLPHDIRLMPIDTNDTPTILQNLDALKLFAANRPGDSIDSADRTVIKISYIKTKTAILMSKRNYYNYLSYLQMHAAWYTKTHRQPFIPKI